MWSHRRCRALSVLSQRLLLRIHEPQQQEQRIAAAGAADSLCTDAAIAASCPLPALKGQKPAVVAATKMRLAAATEWAAPQGRISAGPAYAGILLLLKEIGFLHHLLLLLLFPAISGLLLLSQAEA